jgi:hypothetical protein
LRQDAKGGGRCILAVAITLLFARRVGELMCELSENATPKASYRFYI